MKDKMIVIELVLVIVFAIVAVAAFNTGATPAVSGQPAEWPFEALNIRLGPDIVYDKETGVMYVQTGNYMTLLVNADGSPKLYKQK